jgi:hypothetical protein
VSRASPDARPGSWSLAWPIAAGAAVLIAGTALGWDAGLVERLVALPAGVRAVLVGGSVVVAFALLREALVRLEGSAAGARHDLPTMVRGIRLVFLAVAALAAAAGWLIGHPLPIVVALIVAGVDVLETSFLMIVVSVRGSRA